MCSGMGKRPVVPPVNLDDQSAAVRGPELVRRSRLPQAGVARDAPFRPVDDACRTMYDAFRRGAKLSNNGRCLGWREQGRPYQWLHYNESLLRARNFAAGLVASGVAPGQATNVGVFLRNSPEWTLTQQGCFCFSMVVVPLQEALGDDTCSYIVEQACLEVLVIDSDTKLSGLLGRRLRRLCRVVCTHQPEPALARRAAESGVQLESFAELESAGARAQLSDMPPQPDDVATICYTSGSSGSPRGVMLTHANLVAAVNALVLQLDTCAPSSADTIISFLPLAHMMEQICEAVIHTVGGAVGFYGGELRRLTDDLRQLRPTVVPLVPRQLNRLRDRARAAAADRPLRRRLLRWALAAKQAEVDRSVVRSDSFWDWLVLRRVRSDLGGRVRLVVVGSAPTAPDVLNFARCALGCTVLEGYGQTECAAACTLTVPGDSRPGQVGPPLPCCDVKLVDVPEMGYFASSGQGEVCVRGSNVFKGYYRDPERTREALDGQGWLHTGDIGQWTTAGTLSIVDRKKAVFKLAQGEYVSPERVEAVYLRSRYISQLFVYGHSLKSGVVAVVVPAVAELKAWAAAAGLPGTLSVLCQTPAVRDMVMADMRRLAEQAGLKSFEQVKDIYLHPDPFSTQNNLLTPSLKPKRNEMRKYFKPQLDDLYENLT